MQNKSSLGSSVRPSVPSPTVVFLYKILGSEGLRSRLRRFVIRKEGGPEYSTTIREILRRFHGIEIGLYSTWPYRLKPAVFHSGTTIGRYCSIADTVRTFTRNHPMNTKSTHGFFYNPQLGKVRGTPISFNRLVIGHGALVGHNAIVLPPTEKIGEGALVAPGSVVYSNIPPYAIVSGFPARVTGYRFSKETISQLLSLRWWERLPSDLAREDQIGSNAQSTILPDLLLQP